MMEQRFREIKLPSLVKDVQAIFYEHIMPHGHYNRNQTLKNIRIDPTTPAHYQMAEIIKKYPFLHRHLLIFTLPAKFSTPVHMDGLGNPGTVRTYSCNIPVSGCDTSCVTEFFDALPEDFVADIPGTTRFLKPTRPSVKLAEYFLTDNPILTNTQVPHCVNNRANTQERVSVSWTINHTEWSWDDITKYIDQTEFN